MQEFKMDKVFSPQDVEARIYEKWESSGAFKPVIDPDKAAVHPSSCRRRTSPASSTWATRWTRCRRTCSSATTA